MKLKEGIQTQCDINDWELLVFDSKNDVQRQFRNAQAAIAQKVDALIISPYDSQSCQAVLDIVERADIPVVICDIGTVGGVFYPLSLPRILMDLTKLVVM